MNAYDTGALLNATLNKIAAKKEEPKKEDKKEETPMKGCKYAMKIAESLDYLVAHSDVWLGSPIDRAIAKVATSDSVPNMLSNGPSTGPDGKPINETRDSMSVGEEPSAKPGAAKGKFEGVPNMIPNTANEKPGGASVSLTDPPLYNKTAFKNVLSKLASNKVANSDVVPNELRRMEATDSGKGQSGYDSGGSNGNSGRKLIDSTNERAMSYDKGDAKRGYNKTEMSEVFDEVHPEKDKALDRAFSHGVEGAKLADIKDAKKMEAMAKKEVREEKEEEKVAPGIHKKIEKEAGLSDMAGKALGGAAGVATKAHELGGQALNAGKGAVNWARENPEKAVVGGLAGIGAGTVASKMDDARQAIGDAAGYDPRGIGANIGGSLGSIPGIVAAFAGGHPGLAVPLAAAGGIGGAHLGQRVQDYVTGGQQKMAEKCTCEGKGTCEVCKSKTSKLAAILRFHKEAENVPTNAPAGMTPDVSSQVSPPPEAQGQVPGGEEDQIEKLKKLLLALQMMKQQQMQQGPGAGLPAQPDQAAPGASSAGEMAAGMPAPTQGAI